VDLISVGAQFIGSRAAVVPNVVLYAQVIDGQGGLVGGALDLIFVGAIDDRLRGIFLINKLVMQNARQVFDMISFYFTIEVL